MEECRNWSKTVADIRVDRTCSRESGAESLSRKKQVRKHSSQGSLESTPISSESGLSRDASQDRTRHRKSSEKHAKEQLLKACQAWKLDGKWIQRILADLRPEDSATPMYKFGPVTPLHHLCQNSDISEQTLGYLLDCEDVFKMASQRQPDQNLPVHLLCRNASLNIGMLSQMLLHTDHLEATDQLKMISNLCQNKQMESKQFGLCLFHLLDQKPSFGQSCVALYDDDGRNAWHMACGAHLMSEEILSGLLQRYPKQANWKTQLGTSPFHFLKKEKKEDGATTIIKDTAKLLRRGTSKGWENHGPVQHPSSAISEELVPTDRVQLLFQLCAEVGLQEACREMIEEHGADPDIRTKWDERPPRALGLASVDRKTRRYFRSQGLLFGRYKLYNTYPEHRSSTSIVLRADDQYADYESIFDECFDQETLTRDRSFKRLNRCQLEHVASKLGTAVSHLGLDGETEVTLDRFEECCRRQLGFGLVSRPVAIKVMHCKSVWRREMKNRTLLQAGESNRFIIEYLAAFDNSALKKHWCHDMSEKGALQRLLASFCREEDLTKLERFVLVMPAATRNLQQIRSMEKPNAIAVQTMMKEVFEAIRYMHDKGVIHGDVRPVNVLRFDDHRLRLGDFDAACQIDKDSVGAKFASAAMPPEMFNELKDNDEERLRQYWQDFADQDKIRARISKDNRRYVIKAYKTDEDGQPAMQDALPYSLVIAKASLDMWSLGVMLFGMCAEQDLVAIDQYSSNRDGDIQKDEEIHMIANWTSKKAHVALSKVKGTLPRKLIASLLVTEPQQRMSVQQTLHDEYFNCDNDPRKELVIWSGPCPAGCTKDIANCVLEMSARIARGLGEGVESTGFIIAAGKRKVFESEHTGTWPPSPLSKLKGKGIYVADCLRNKAYWRYIESLFIQDWAIILDGDTGEFLTDSYEIHVSAEGNKQGGSGLKAASVLAERAEAFVVKGSTDACRKNCKDRQLVVFPGQIDPVTFLI